MHGENVFSDPTAEVLNFATHFIVRDEFDESTSQSSGYQCPECNSSIQRKDAFQRHLKIKHKIQKGDPRYPSVDTLECPILYVEFVMAEEDNDLSNVTDRKGDCPESPEASCEKKRAGEEMQQESLQHVSHSDVEAEKSTATSKFRIPKLRNGKEKVRPARQTELKKPVSSYIRTVPPTQSQKQPLEKDKRIVSTVTYGDVAHEKSKRMYPSPESTHDFPVKAVNHGKKTMNRRQLLDSDVNPCKLFNSPVVENAHEPSPPSNSIDDSFDLGEESIPFDQAISAPVKRSKPPVKSVPRVNLFKPQSEAQALSRHEPQIFPPTNVTNDRPQHPRIEY